MKKFVLLIVTILAAGISTAHAAQFELNSIDIDDCRFVVSEIALLNSNQVNVRAICSPEGEYGSRSGRIYRHRVTTLINVPGPVARGTQIPLNFIDTDDCERAQRLVATLSTPEVRVDAQCSDYSYQSYGSDQGRRYNFRLYTTMTVE